VIASGSVAEMRALVSRREIKRESHVKFLQAQCVIWPSFHLNQIATGVAGLAEFHVMPTITSVAVLTGMTILFGGLAIRRLARKG
jgi:hypothetical protein